MGLPAVARACWGRSRCRGHSSPSAQLWAAVCGVRAVALASNSRVYYLLPPRDLSTGQGGRDRRRGARIPPHTRPRARAAAPPACQADPARVPHPPPAFHPRSALSAPLSPTPRGPAHAQHAARVACPLVGPASSLAAHVAATSKVAAGRAVNELVGPRGPRAPAHPRVLPTGAGGGATRGPGEGDADAETPAAAVDSAAAVPAAAAAVVAAVAAVATALHRPPRRPRRPRPPRRPPRRLPLSTATVAATDARARRRRRRRRPSRPQCRRRRRRRRRRRCRPWGGVRGAGGPPPGCRGGELELGLEGADPKTFFTLAPRGAVFCVLCCSLGFCGSVEPPGSVGE